MEASRVIGFTLNLGAPTKSTDERSIGDGGPAESDYPNDDQIRGAFIPPAGPLVFFSGLPDPQNNQAPFEFTKTVPGATILRGAFPKAYITRKPQGGPRRSLEWYQNFLDRASGVYTDKAVEKGETVFFVGTWDAQVRDCSIWNTIELPTLKAAGIPVTLVDYAISRTRGITQGPIPRILSIPFSNLRRNVTKWVIWTSLRREIPGSASIGLALARMPMIRTLTRAWIQGTILFQKNEGPAATNGKHGISDYRFSIQIKDANQELIGQVDYFDAPTGQGVNVNSKLPAVLVAIAGGVDSDPVTFAYGGQNWDSNSKQCSTGGYQNGSRQMDCGFTCYR
ncbi:hypothetical protein Q9189_007654 [Teloschistes chrysophthalmus]